MFLQQLSPKRCCDFSKRALWSNRHVHIFEIVLDLQSEVRQSQLTSRKSGRKDLATLVPLLYTAMDTLAPSELAVMCISLNSACSTLMSWSAIFFPLKYLDQSVFWSSMTSSVRCLPEDVDDVTLLAPDTAAPRMEAPWSLAWPVSDCTLCSRDSLDLAGLLGALVVFEPGFRFSDRSPELDWDWTGGGGGGGTCQNEGVFWRWRGASEVHGEDSTQVVSLTCGWDVTGGPFV